MSAAKVAVVTGANKGIGYAVVKGLLQHHSSWLVYLTSRNKDRGMDAVQQICRETDILPAFHELDIRSVDSVKAFARHLSRERRRIDVLINNAGIYPRQNQFSDTSNPHFRGRVFNFDLQIVRNIVDVNYFGTLNICRELLPMLSDDSRVVNVSSSLSQAAFNQLSPRLQSDFRGCRTIEDVTVLINSFLAMAPTDYVRNGWVTKLRDEATGCFSGDILPYGLSKIGVNLMTRIFQCQSDASLKDHPDKCILINACSPGPIKTDANPLGVKSIEQGAETLIHLAALPKSSALRGQFLHERRIEDPFTGVAISSLRF